jgi:hypothetical protein
MKWAHEKPRAGAAKRSGPALAFSRRVTRTSAHRPLLRAALGLAALLAACRGSDAPPPTASAQTADTASGYTAGLRPPAEVVIARPSGRYEADSVPAAGSITGTIVTSAPIAARPAVATGADSALCGPAVADSSAVQSGNGLGGAVVWLDDVRRGRPLPLERRLELESTHCVLSPRVQAGVVESAVNVLGHDAFRQHLFFLAGGEREPRASVLLGNEDQVVPTNKPFSAPGLVIVRDADHSWPAAYIAVFDHPYFAVSAPNGSFTIEGVPPGRHTLHVWHERTTGAAQPVDVPLLGNVSITVTLTPK